MGKWKTIEPKKWKKHTEARGSPRGLMGEQNYINPQEENLESGNSWRDTAELNHR